jgi:hypothetical protein
LLSASYDTNITQKELIMSLHSYPSTIPGDWIANKRIPSGDGCYCSWKVVHPVSGAHPFCLHTAWYVDEEGSDAGTFQYGNGKYFRTEAEAVDAFENPT